MKEIIRKAIHTYLLEDRVDPNAELFKIFPLGASGKKGHHTALDHDEELYGPARP